MTCNGLDAAIDTWFKAYMPFLQKKAGAAGIDEAGCCGGDACCGDGSCEKGDEGCQHGDKGCQHGDKGCDHQHNHQHNQEG